MHVWVLEASPRARQSPPKSCSRVTGVIQFFPFFLRSTQDFHTVPTATATTCHNGVWHQKWPNANSIRTRCKICKHVTKYASKQEWTYWIVEFFSLTHQTACETLHRMMRLPASTRCIWTSRAHTHTCKWQTVSTHGWSNGVLLQWKKLKTCLVSPLFLGPCPRGWTLNVHKPLRGNDVFTGFSHPLQWQYPHVF